ncbi:hypothetical protein UlMin_008621 [Ulmus minor]
MEGSESEAVFDSLNLNPQLFINEVLNTVDDLVDDAFNYYHQEASSALNAEGTGRSQDLTKGVNLIHKMVQSVLNKRLAMWEEFCLNHCFEVPQGFSLPKNDEPSSNSLACEDALHDPYLDAQLESLRNKLILVGKESASLNRELQATDHYAGLINEVLQCYAHNSSDKMLEEMAGLASELKEKMGKLKTRRMEANKRIRSERLHTRSDDQSMMDYEIGFPDAKLEELQDFLGEVKN